MSAIVAAEILARVSSESLIPLRAIYIFVLSFSVHILPVAAYDRLFLVSSLTLRSFLKNSRVFSLCLNPKGVRKKSKKITFFYFFFLLLSLKYYIQVLKDQNSIVLYLQDLSHSHSTLIFLD